MRTFMLLLVVLFLPAVVFAEEAPISGKQWAANLQAIGQKYTRGNTSAQNALSRRQVVEEIASLEQAVVKMTATVRDVRWRDGVAAVYTEAFLPEQDLNAPRPPLKIIRTSPLELRMEEAAAASIEPGAAVVFEGTLTFNPYRYGAVGKAVGAQQMHTVSHNTLPGTPLGTFTSTDCTISIDGKLYPTRWATP